MFSNKYLYLKFYKPYGYLSQFTQEVAGQKTLADFDLPPDVYCCGRLDKDSEGLILLSNDGGFQHRVSHPQFNKEKIYYVQVEGDVEDSKLEAIRKGLFIKGHHCLPAKVNIITEPQLPKREPPIRTRKSIPTTWLELILCEGKNRQVRKMTAAIGYPTLRLHRHKIAHIELSGLSLGEYTSFDPRSL